MHSNLKSLHRMVQKHIQQAADLQAEMQLSGFCEPVPSVAPDSCIKQWEYLYLFSAQSIHICRPNPEYIFKITY